MIRRRQGGSRHPGILVLWAGVFVAVFALLTIALEELARVLGSPGPSPDVSVARNAVRLAETQLLAGLVLAAGLVFTARTYYLSRDMNAVEQFSKAVEHLASENSVAARSGGLAAIGTLVSLRPQLWPATVQVLSAFIRDKSIADVGERPDVTVALWTLGLRPRASFRDSPATDLSGSILRGASLAGGNFERVNFRKCDLREADFSGARLKAADFTGARLDGARFHSADLSEANFQEATLIDAVLYKANVLDTDFQQANLTGADMTGILNSESTQFEASHGI